MGRKIGWTSGKANMSSIKQIKAIRTSATIFNRNYECGFLNILNLAFFLFCWTDSSTHRPATL